MTQVFEDFLQAFIAGVLTGTNYGLMCVGLSLIFGVMRVINFAQGDFMMLGMYTAYYVFGFFGVSLLFGPSVALPCRACRRPNHLCVGHFDS